MSNHRVVLRQTRQLSLAVRQAESNPPCTICTQSSKGVGLVTGQPLDEAYLTLDFSLPAPEEEIYYFTMLGRIKDIAEIVHVSTVRRGQHAPADSSCASFGFGTHKTIAPHGNSGCAKIALTTMDKLL